MDLEYVYMLGSREDNIIMDVFILVFILGCMMDLEFVYLLESWNGSAIFDVK